MNLVRAISLGGGGGELRGNDSTNLICHVQLVILAIDCVFNIVVDNFLRDPLVVLIIFICQVFLLIIILIFYLMASANQAMKQGIQEKLLRHHQVTIILWTIYFSMLIWWYSWTLKRSWPSAGDHFSFSFSGSSDADYMTTQEQFEVTTGLPIKNLSETIQSTIPQIAIITAVTKAAMTRTTTTIKPKTKTTATVLNPKANDSTINSTIDISEMSLNDTAIMTSIQKNKTRFLHENMTESVPGINSTSKLSSHKLISNAPSNINEILEQTDEEEDNVEEMEPLVGALLTSDTIPNISIKENPINSSHHNVHSESDTVTLFWSPGFIAVYTIERSVSLFFYVAYILGTFHIVNAHLTDEQSDKALNHVPHHRSRNKNNNLNSKSSMYNSPMKYNSHNQYIESDSNFDDYNGDNFIRQLEDQDGDPFENAQYEYQYNKNNYSLYPYSINPHGRDRDGRKGRVVETSDGEDASIKSSGTDVDITGPSGRKNIKGKKNNLRQYADRDNFTSRARSAFKIKSPKQQKVSKTKGGLRNMMMMAELGNLNTKTAGDQGGGGSGGIYMTTADSSENPVIVTAAVDSVAGSGSTDELLVAELFNRSDNNYYNQGNKAFDHDNESEESDDRIETERLGSNQRRT